MRLLRAIAVAAAFACAGCATVQGGWWFVHDTKTEQETNADYALCQTAWLASPMKAEIERQIAAEEAVNKGYHGLYFKRKRMANQHVELCMKALEYRMLWFDEHSPHGRTYKAKPRVGR